VRLASLWIGGVAAFVLTGCWEVQKSHTLIEFSRARGSGSLRVQLSGIHCVEKGAPCEGTDLTAEIVTLKRVPGNVSKMLRTLRFSQVNASLKAAADGKTFDGDLTGKFDSLTQFPFFESLTVTRPEAGSTATPGGLQRQDLILDYTVAKGDLTLIGAAATYVFRSVDKDGEILEASPPGKLDVQKRSVTWENPPVQDGKTKFTLRLKGREYRLD